MKLFQYRELRAKHHPRFVKFLEGNWSRPMDGLVFYYDVEKVIRLGPIQVFVCGLVERKKTTSYLPTYLLTYSWWVGPLYALVGERKEMSWYLLT